MSFDPSGWLPGLLGPVILQTAGTPLPALRGTWNFVGVTIADDGPNDTLTFTVSTDLPTDFAIAGQTAGDLLYFDGTHWVRLATPGDTQYLTSSGGTPGWGDPTHVYVEEVATDTAISNELAGTNARHIVVTTGGKTVTLPMSPNGGDTYEITAFYTGASGSPTTVNGNGRNINGAATVSLATDYETACVRYSETSDVWVRVS